MEQGIWSMGTISVSPRLGERRNRKRIKKSFDEGVWVGRFDQQT
jgi:hypothetical protein